MKYARLVIGLVIIKHKLLLSDRETVAQIQENPYLKYFVGLPGYQMEAPFVPSLFVEVRKRMGPSVFDVFQAAVIDSVEEGKASQGRRSRARDQIKMMVTHRPFPLVAHSMKNRYARVNSF